MGQHQKRNVSDQIANHGTHFAQLQLLSLSLIQCSPQEAMTVWTIHNGETVSGKSKNYIELMKKVGLPG
jgi:hypothetical protein